ncbi:glycosyltransferase [Comamonas sp. Tr-654]|nr:glycosyltransferase [Comamonas sp. Tr-654]
MNAFLVVSLLMDRRPAFTLQSYEKRLPAITILVAAYNEEASILSTLASIDRQNYPGELSVIVVDDSSTDDTLRKLETVAYPWLQVLRMPQNVGKARARQDRYHTDGGRRLLSLQERTGQPDPPLYQRPAQHPCRGRSRADTQLPQQLRDQDPGVGLLPRHCRHQTAAEHVPRDTGRPGRFFRL